MEFLLKVSDWLKSVVIAVGRVAAWLALLLMLVILFDVVTRYMKGSDWIDGYPALREFFATIDPWASSTKLQELEWHLHGALFLLCLGYAYLKDAHVRIELLRDNFSLRLRAWVEMFGIILGLLFYCFVVINYGFDFAERAFVRNEGSSAMTGLPARWIIKSFLPIGFLFLALAGISVLLRCFVFLVGPPHLRDESGEFLKPKTMLEDEGATIEEIVAEER
jgi:TRAP-type mannitol/chloroaromatic compound transport system permease small subunit